MPRPKLEQGNLDTKRIQELVTKMQSSFPTALEASCNAIDELYQWADDSSKNYQEDYGKLTEFVDCFVELYKCSKNTDQLTDIWVELKLRDKRTNETKSEINTVDVYFKQVMKRLGEQKDMTGIHKMLRNRLLESFGKPDGINSEETELYNNILNDITSSKLRENLNNDYKAKGKDNAESDYKRMVNASIVDSSKKSYLFENSYELYNSWIANNQDKPTKASKIDSPYLGFYVKGAQSFMHIYNDKNDVEKIKKDEDAKIYQKFFIQSRYYMELKNIKDKENELSAAQSKITDLENELKDISNEPYLNIKNGLINSFKESFAGMKYEEKFTTFAQKLQVDLVRLDGTNGTKKGANYREMTDGLRFLRDNNDVLATLMNKGAKDFLDVDKTAKPGKMIEDLKRVRKSVEDYISYKHDAGTYKFFNFVGKKRYSAALDIKGQLDGMISTLSKLDEAKSGPNENGLNDAYREMEGIAKNNRKKAEYNDRIDEAKKEADAITNSINASKKHLEMYDFLSEKNKLGELEKQLQEDIYYKTEGLSYGEAFKNAAKEIDVNSSKEMQDNYYFNEAHKEFLASITKAGGIEQLGFDNKVNENKMNDKISEANMDYVKDIVASVTTMNMISRQGEMSTFGKIMETCEDTKIDYKSLKEVVLNNKNVQEELGKMTYGDLYRFMHNDGKISKLSDSARQNVAENMISKAAEIAGKKIKNEQPVAKKQNKKVIQAEANNGMGARH